MATALDIITRSLQDLRVYGAGETPSAADTQFCLDALNDMLNEWAITGIDLAHLDLVSADTIDVPADHLSAIRRNLSLRVAGAFGAQVSELDGLLAMQGEEALRGYHFSMNDLSDDNPLSRDNLPTCD